MTGLLWDFVVMLGVVAVGTLVVLVILGLLFCCKAVWEEINER